MSVSSPESQRLPRRKKIDTACDSCRIKKTRCDGRHPCSRCIFDNSICVFTKKKKLKENYPPNGYLEMLETRVDLLTRSLLKVVSIAEPHLPFLQQIKRKAEITNSNITPPEQTESSVWKPPIPINDIVSYLISDFVLNHGGSASAMEHTDFGCDTLNSASPQNNCLHQKEINPGDEVESRESYSTANGSPEVVNIAGNQYGLESKPISQTIGHCSYDGTNSINPISLYGNEISTAISGNCRDFNFNEPQGEQIFSTFGESIGSSLMETSYVNGKEPQSSPFLNNGGNISTSSSSLSSLCAKMDNNYLENAASYNTPMMQIQSPFLTGNPGHGYNQQIPNYSHTPHISRITTTVPEQILTNQGIYPLQPGSSVTPMEYGNHLLFNVPPSRLMDEAVPFVLEDEERSIDQSLNSFQ